MARYDPLPPLALAKTAKHTTRPLRFAAPRTPVPNAPMAFVLSIVVRGPRVAYFL
jgi:hypothetical protein